MDCNSIIYDVVHAHPEVVEHENIIEFVIAKIREYIRVIRPTRFTMVAFDGVAPMAKMEQQRLRRFKSVTATTTAEVNIKPTIGFNTVQITPGTPFMTLLSKKMEAAFSGDASVVVATSSGAGEGEQKLFAHLRANPCTDCDVAVYGLDADLIMLALLHLDYARNIFVCREEDKRKGSARGQSQNPGQSQNQGPHDNGKNSVNSVKSGNSGNSEKDVEDLIFLDARALSLTLCAEMATTLQKPGIEEYAFLCLFLGNDFLPHFPTLNLRTVGLNRLMEAYRAVISSHPSRRLVRKTRTIPEQTITNKHYSVLGSNEYVVEWKNVAALVGELARYEQEFLRQEMVVRDGWEVAERRRLTTQGSGIEVWMESAPVLFREIEHYICNGGVGGGVGGIRYGWRGRYYRALFSPGVEPREVTKNYAEGLDWVLQYYTRGCVDTRWKYRYAYPPLLGDLAAGGGGLEGAEWGRGGGGQTFVSPREQLLYVVPPAFYSIVGLGEETGGENKRPQYRWAFCRFLWEAHLEFKNE